MYYINAIEALMTQANKINLDSEIIKARQIVEQLDESIQWLDFEISKKMGYQEKADLQKEKTAAEWERERLAKEINKVKQ